MSAYDKLLKSIYEKKSLLCVGLDTDVNKIPQFLGRDLNALLTFNKAIIDATKKYVACYKINFAFYEKYGAAGFELLKETFDYIPKDIYTIADAKRGDIGNTSESYAKSVFEYFKADSITVSPYMGSDSVKPFLSYKDKMVFLLCLTSNEGSKDFQYLQVDGKPLYQHVMAIAQTWAGADQLGFVVGATHPEELDELRQLAPDNFFLIPGIGAQGGDLKATMLANAGINKSNLGLVNSSRAIIYASRGEDYIEKATEMAKQTYKEINEVIGW